MAATKRVTERTGAVRGRIERLFLGNLGKKVTRDQIIAAARDPVTGRDPENWHQRMSELRTDAGYTILSKRDGHGLGVGEYMMPDASRRSTAGRRIKPTAATWRAVLERADSCCEWAVNGSRCGLHDGDRDPVGGGTVRLQADHATPHEVNPETDPSDPSQWQALCGRHQVQKKNFWDSATGKLNVYAILQAASDREKRRAFEFLAEYFGYQVSPGSLRVGLANVQNVPED